MNITLYRNCPLTNDYKIVFNTGYYSNNYTDNAFNLMLNSLPSTTLSIPDAYLNDNGKIYLDLAYDNQYILSLYNYLSFEIQTNAIPTSFSLPHASPYNYVNAKSSNGLLRYAFITNIKYFNDCIEIDYECDYYHTYARFTQYFDGLLTRYSYAKIYILNSVKYPNVKLNTPYFSNKKLLKYSITGNNSSSVLTGNRECYCFASIQYYTLDAQGERTSRRLDTVMIMINGTQGLSNGIYKAQIDVWNKYIVNLLLSQSVSGQNITSTGECYEIQDIFFIPNNLNEVTSGGTESYKIEDWYANITDTLHMQYLYLYSTSNGIQITYNNVTTQYYLMSLSNYFDNDSYPSYKTTMSHSFTLTSGTISNVLERKGIGFYTHMIPITSDNPNLKLEYEIIMAFDCSNIRFYLEVENQIIEITDDLKVEYPISIQTADATQLQAVARTINNVKVKNQSQTQAYNKLFDASTGFSIGTLFTPGRLLQSVGNVMESYNTLGQAEQDLKLLNAEVYTTNTSVDADSLAFINAYYGLLDFRLDTTNDDVVNDNTKKQGYIVSTDLLCDKENALFGLVNENNNGYDASRKYNQVPYMRYSNVYIAGNYPQNVRDILKQIMERGFRFVNSYNALDYESYL